jgi:hypothetical protein
MSKMPSTYIKRGLELIERDSSKVLGLKVGKNVVMKPGMYVPKAGKNIRTKKHSVHD